MYQIYVDNVFERKALVALAQKAGLMTMSKLANNYVLRYQKIYLRAGVTKCKGTNKSHGFKTLFAAEDPVEDPFLEDFWLYRKKELIIQEEIIINCTRRVL